MVGVIIIRFNSHFNVPPVYIVGPSLPSLLEIVHSHLQYLGILFVFQYDRVV